MDNFLEELILPEKPIEVFDLKEDGSIFVERNSDGVFLTDGDSFIDLSSPFNFADLKIIQNEVIIELETIEMLDYLKTLLEELLNA